MTWLPASFSRCRAPRPELSKRHRLPGVTTADCCMSACEHLDSPGFHSDALAAQHTTFAWYVSIVHLSRHCSCFDRVPVVMCFISVCQSIGHFKVRFQHGKSFFVPDCCHRCSHAQGTSASSPFVRTFPLRSAATSPLRRFLITGSSVRPKSSRSRFNTASQSSFRIAAIGVWMHGARLQARRLSGRCRFDQQQHRLCGVS